MFHLEETLRSTRSNDLNLEFGIRDGSVESFVNLKEEMEISFCALRDLFPFLPPSYFLSFFLSHKRHGIPTRARARNNQPNDRGERDFDVSTDTLLANAPVLAGPVDFSRETRRLRAVEYFHRLPALWKFASSRHRRRYGWERRVGLRLDKGQGPVIRWRDDFLIIAPSSLRAPGGLLPASRVCVYT